MNSSREFEAWMNVSGKRKFISRKVTLSAWRYRIDFKSPSTNNFAGASSSIHHTKIEDWSKQIFLWKFSRLTNCSISFKKLQFSVPHFCLLSRSIIENISTLSNNLSPVWLLSRIKDKGLTLYFMHSSFASAFCGTTEIWKSKSTKTKLAKSGCI